MGVEKMDKTQKIWFDDTRADGKCSYQNCNKKATDVLYQEMARVPEFAIAYGFKKGQIAKAKYCKRHKDQMLRDNPSVMFALISKKVNI